MAYGRSRLTASAQAGDPFLGGIIKTIGKGLGIAGKILPGPLGGVARIAGGVLAPQRRLPPAPPQFMPGGILPTQFGRPRQVPSRAAPRMPGMAPRRRRMNPNNPQALRRAVRRISSWDRQRKSVEKSLRKIAPKPARRSRRDLGPGHRHVR